MQALQITKQVDLLHNDTPLELVDIPRPEPGADEVRIRILVCGVCHTELDEIEGRTPPPRYPVTPGHQVVGLVDKLGPGVRERKIDERVGVAWFYSSCHDCQWCLTGRENLCPQFKATGRDVDGGYAQYMVVPESATSLIPEQIPTAEAAPMLCAGAIGYRSLQLAQLRDGASLGLTGFGASAHLVLKLVRYQLPDIPVYVFARNAQERDFARELGAAWAGESHERAPQQMQAIIDTTPAWTPVVRALGQLEPGGRLIINAIRKEDGDREQLSRIDYEHDLWMEKSIQSVANVTRNDVRAFLKLAAEIPLKPTIEEFPMSEGNRVLVELKKGTLRGAKVLRIGAE